MTHDPETGKHRALPGSYILRKLEAARILGLFLVLQYLQDSFSRQRFPSASAKRDALN